MASLSIIFRRNVVNIMLFIADSCKRYFSADEVPHMLEEFLPLLTKEVSYISTSAIADHSHVL